MTTFTRTQKEKAISNHQKTTHQVAPRKEALRLVAEGLKHYKSRNLTKAIDLYRLALAADPQCQEAQERLEYALEEQEDILSEIKSARVRLVTCPEDVQARFRLAQRLEALSYWEEAIAEFASVSRIDTSGRWGTSAQKMIRKHAQQMTL